MWRNWTVFIQDSILSVAFIIWLRAWTVLIVWNPGYTDLMKMKLWMDGTCILYISLPLGKWAYFGPSLVFLKYHGCHDLDFDEAAKNYIVHHRCFRSFCAPPFDRSAKKKKPSSSVVVLFWLPRSLTLVTRFVLIAMLSKESRFALQGYRQVTVCLAIAIDVCNNDLPRNSMLILYKVMSFATIVSSFVNLGTSTHVSISFFSVANIIAECVQLKEPVSISTSQNANKTFGHETALRFSLQNSVVSL